MSLLDRDYYKEKSSLNFNESKGEMILDDKRIKNNNSTVIHEKVKNDIKKNISELDVSKKSFSFFPWIVALLVILAISKAIHKNIDIEQPLVKIESNISPKILPLPPTSILFSSYDIISSKSPFTLQADNKNYYIKLCDSIHTGKTVAIFFVRAGEILNTKVPFGQYTIKYASGVEWKGEHELFGEFSQYGKSQILSFDSDGLSSRGHMISFYRASNGNFKTDAVSRDYILQN